MTIQEAQEKVAKAQAAIEYATAHRPSYAPKGRMTRSESDAMTDLDAAMTDLKIAQGTLKMSNRNSDSMRDSGNFENFSTTYKRAQ